MPRLAHAVYFTLKHRTPEAAAKLVASCQKHLTGHPGTEYFAVGTCASEYDREVNDRDHDVALVIVFDSHAAHDAYQTAPRTTAPRPTRPRSASLTRWRLPGMSESVTA